MTSRKAGFSLFELLVIIAMLSAIMLPLSMAVQQSVLSWRHTKNRKEYIYQGTFAMEKMVESVRNTKRILLPLAENPWTPHKESERNLFAVTIDPRLDRNSDGFVDADNDKDGLIDEDIPPDNTNDFSPGIIGIDDDNDGFIDEGGGMMAKDNDEDGSQGEDWINGKDDDADGSLDEDIAADNKGIVGFRKGYDNDGDGRRNEDWLDPVVYYVNNAGNALIERFPLVNSQDGSQYKERIIASAVQVVLTVRRVPVGAGLQPPLLEITMELNDGTGVDPVLLHSLTRVGGGIL